MSVKALLNSIEESQVIDETMDDEIFQAIQNVRKAQEVSHSGSGLRGGDDEADDDVQLEEIPSQREVLMATSLINGYIAGLDDPLARKMEVLLHSFRQQLHLDAARNMVATSITDYFEHV